VKSKAIIFDIDGTAIDSPEQKIPSKRLVKAIKAIEEQYFMCAATGRVWSFAEPVLKALKLIDPCIISGGTQICNPQSGEILWQINIEQVDLNEVIKIAKKYPYKVLYNDYDIDEYLYGGLDPTNLVIKGQVYFLEITFVPEEKVQKIIDKLNKVPGIAVVLTIAMRPGFKDIHITNKSATKEHAIVELISTIGIKQEGTIGVGDGHNDIHLFNAVNHKVAMGNAVEELRDASDETIGNVSDDGFAKYLERLRSRPSS
jgi:Cof subfamily protein (haloacid dehalogenase superfamily)